MAGVESAVQIHIDRGDDLNARDNKGQTPLMLAAARNKATICKLLLAAGADADLLDPLGSNAYAIAQATGALDAAAVIEAACVPKSASAGDNGLDGHTHFIQDECWEQAENDIAFGGNGCAGPVQPTGALAAILELKSATVAVASQASDDECDEFDLTGWEAEEDQPPPEGDQTLSTAAFEIQSAINEHQPIDTSADWGDFEAFLPDRATPLPCSDDSEARERLRLVVLRAIREGSVPHSAIEDLTRGDDGESDAEADALLGMVINDLGAETDERFEYSAPHESFEVFVAPGENSDEEEVVADALAFVDDLAGRRNEPLRIYQREFQREALLTAAAEVALGQAMERGIERSLDALAAWPSGIGAVLEAAREVARGAKPLRCMSSGSEIEPEETEFNSKLELPAESEAIDAEESDSQFDLDAKEFPDKLAEFCTSAELLSNLAVDTSQDTPEWEACRSTLTSLGLTRGFLVELADSGLAGESERSLAFAQAMKGYRRARDQMAVANLKLVFSIAKKYMFSGQPLDDLLQEGNIGLIKAVDRYDWSKGFKFSTYATWWIRQQIGRFIADKGKTIRLPVHVYEKTQRIAQAACDFELKHGHGPSVEEIAALVELPAHKVSTLSRLGMDPLPLHGLPDIDDLITADAKDHFTLCDPMEIVEDIQLGESVDRFLSMLKPKEENVLRMRFGIGVQKSMTLEEVGVHFEVTRERIRQIEATALRRLRHPARLDRFLLELGLTPRCKLRVNTSSDSDSDFECDAPIAMVAFPAPEPKVAARRPEQQMDTGPMALDKVLDQVREAGILVEDSLEGDTRRLWVHITNTPDNRSRKIVRKLIALGFEYWPGKGYWR
ncbi:sigma-70 family RNA polymerase sigma factor [Andreprevotia sp. IGB-42]|uniref:sigma-70 family RNA polymerase sigma factor n=1 Tax=Andreprevotia sp. IGB-42 TaxID=2497473 RepID=UPI00135BD72D|nr:sigma-70 family RNA polymerase sigma factor [Andreprevotia sp. IGB-42]